MSFPHIVAPGGSYQKALVASKYGAEEVYIGVPFTSLRMRQNKITGFDELYKTVDALHANGTKVFLTMNIFPRNQDIKVFEAVVEHIAKAGADAIIFSDPGTYNIIRKYMPDMPLHLSTQANSLNAEALKFRRDLGVKRIVLSRETHISEIIEMKKQVPEMELEVFVHGSVCMSYSGRCFLGDYMNGRPGNKGECSHACRFKYKVWIEEERRPGKFYQLEDTEDGVHILSSKDLCVIDRLEEILPYVDAIKIEGRSKSAFYVGSTVKAYKHVRDAIIAKTPIDPAIQNLVNTMPHRPYRSGFLLNKLNDYPEGEGVDETTETTKTPENADFKVQLPPENSEETSTTPASAGPLFARNYFGTFGQETMKIDGKNYFRIDPKEVIRPGMTLKFIAPNSMGELTILDIVNKNGHKIEKADCNIRDVYMLTDRPLNGLEILYTYQE